MKKNIKRNEIENLGKKGWEKGEGPGSSEKGYEGRQENQKQRGYEEISMYNHPKW